MKGGRRTVIITVVVGPGFPSITVEIEGAGVGESDSLTVDEPPAVPLGAFGRGMYPNRPFLVFPQLSEP